MASDSGKKNKKSHWPLPSGFQFDIPLLGVTGNAKQLDPEIQLLSAMMKRHVQGLSASLLLPKTMLNKAGTFDSLHSSNKRLPPETVP